MLNLRRYTDETAMHKNNCEEASTIRNKFNDAEERKT